MTTKRVRSAWRHLAAASLVAALTGGCILVSGQFVIDFDFGDVTIANPSLLIPIPIDLNTIDDYVDHKDDLKDVSDLALLGELTNNLSSDVDVEIYFTPGATAYTDDTTVRSQGIRLWGPFHLEGNETVRIGWDESAALFNTAGRAALVQEIKGDGVFTIYALGAAGVYSFSIDDGRFVFVLDAGK